MRRLSGAVKRLMNAGMPEAQAEVLAEEQFRLIAERPATKRDLGEMEARLGAKVDADIAGLDAKIDRLEVKVFGELRLVKWMLALVIAATVVPLIRDFL